jgi:hypothetical protein
VQNKEVPLASPILGENTQNKNSGKFLKRHNIAVV